MRPTYQQQFDKITTAYIRDEIKPFSGQFCFCGTLAGSPYWVNIKYNADNLVHKNCVVPNPFDLYRPSDYYHMELALFNAFEPLGLRFRKCLIEGSTTSTTTGFPTHYLEQLPQYEECLFNGMEAALQVLKQIHINYGEDIDSTPVFKQRQLQAI